MSKFMDELMAELIPYGGVATPRSVAYFDALARTGDEQAADRMAMSPKALQGEDVLRWIPYEQAIKAGITFLGGD